MWCVFLGYFFRYSSGLNVYLGRSPPYLMGLSGGGFGGSGGAKSRRGKTIYLPLLLTHSAGWISYSWVFLNGELTDFTGFVFNVLCFNV